MHRFQLAALLMLTIGCQRPPTTASVVSKETTGLHNVQRINDKLYSGSSPEGDDGFRSLTALGVKTVLSVDGARPDVELARKHGLRYVHLPIGYDGVPEAQALRIARAVRDLPGPVYLHCHHGKHRGPAAAAVVHRMLDEACDVETAVAVMKRAGTDPRYTGLYASPAQIRRPTQEELDRVPADFPEVSPVPDLARLMVALDLTWDRMKEIRNAGWKAPAAHPDLDPPHEALQLREHYREAARLESMKQRPEEFRRMLSEAESAAGELEAALRSDRSKTEQAYRKSADACLRCHARYRDVPQTPG